MKDNTLVKIKEAFYHNHLGKGCDNDFVYDLIEKFEKEAKKELLADFKMANPYYYTKIEECIDFQRIIRELKWKKQKR